MQTIEEIQNQLKTEDAVVLEFKEAEIKPDYFNSLVIAFKDYFVSEIHPLKKVIIHKGVSTSQIEKHLDQMLEIILAYHQTRKSVFNGLLDELGISDIEGKFYKLREKLQEQNKWPRGDYKEWKYWAHGGDVEFDNSTTEQHFNVNMAMVDGLKSWSVYNHILRSMKGTELFKFIYNRPEIVSKMFDLYVIDGRLKSVRTFFGAKLYTFSNTKVRMGLLAGKE